MTWMARCRLLALSTTWTFGPLSPSAAPFMVPMLMPMSAAPPLMSLMDIAVMEAFGGSTLGGGPARDATFVGRGAGDVTSAILRLPGFASIRQLTPNGSENHEELSSRQCGLVLGWNRSFDLGAAEREGQFGGDLHHRMASGDDGLQGLCSRQDFIRMIGLR